MKRVLYLFISLLPTLSFAFDLDVEARAAWLVPKSSTMRDVFGKGLPIYEIELGLPLNSCFTLFSNVSYFEASGRSSQDFKSEVENYGLIFGGKFYLEPWMNFRPYAGLGLGGGYIRFHDHSPFARSHVDRLGWAFLAKIGTEVCLSRYYYIDLFADYIGFNYSFKSKSGTVGHRFNAGGIKAGAAFCIRF